MKNIDISKRSTKQSSLDIVLGNGKRISFSSMREKKRFIADTNRFLTKCLVIINDTYAIAFAEYRQMWFTAANSNMGTKTNYLKESQIIKNHLDGVESMLAKFNITNWGSNDPFFSFIDIKKAGLFLHEACAILEKFYKKRNYTIKYHSCMVLKERCLLVIDKLQNWDYVK